MQLNFIFLMRKPKSLQSQLQFIVSSSFSHYNNDCLSLFIFTMTPLREWLSNAKSVSTVARRTRTCISDRVSPVLPECIGGGSGDGPSVKFALSLRRSDLVSEISETDRWVYYIIILCAFVFFMPIRRRVRIIRSTEISVLGLFLNFFFFFFSFHRESGFSHYGIVNEYPPSNALHFIIVTRTDKWA